VVLTSLVARFRTEFMSVVSWCRCHYKRCKTRFIENVDDVVHRNLANRTRRLGRRINRNLRHDEPRTPQLKPFHSRFVLLFVDKVQLGFALLREPFAHCRGCWSLGSNTCISSARESSRSCVKNEMGDPEGRWISP
jgi:hypothetical protein